MSAVENHLIERVRAALKREGVSQSQLARELGVSRQSLNQVMTGKRSLITPTLVKLCERLKLEIVLEKQE